MHGITWLAEQQLASQVSQPGGGGVAGGDV
jgi:hypothetical protein